MSIGTTGLILLVLLGGLFLQRVDHLKGAQIVNPKPAPEIHLIDQNGNQFRLSDWKGKVVLLFFGYASCPDVCPTTLSELRRVRSMLSDEQAKHVQVVFVTVDPERDTVERIQAYVSAFDPAFLGLVDSLETLEPIYQAYGVFREINTSSGSAAGYLVTHTARVYLVDTDGNLRLTYSFGTPPEDIAHDIRILLKE
ncbi:MAG: SCO family protein [Anaerolineales bacterium]|nr:SCO family protein [Anaerolineales bacterium]